MALLQPKLSLKVAQRQILTPGLMQMVSVLALNKLELKEMINAEIVENPILEELEESVPLLDDVEGRQAERDRPVEETAAAAETTQAERDPFDEIDFGSYFQEYLDPGFRTPNSFEQSDKPSFENFLSQPSTLTDHLFWQLGSLPIRTELRDAAEYIIGNLDEDGYLVATEDELIEGFLRERIRDGAATPVMNGHQAGALLAEAIQLAQKLDPCGVATRDLRECLLLQIDMQRREFEAVYSPARHPANGHTRPAEDRDLEQNGIAPNCASAEESEPAAPHSPGHLREAEPAGVHCKRQAFQCAHRIIDEALPLLLKRDLSELSKAVGVTPAEAQTAVDLIRNLDPRPGQRFNRSDVRLIEPDVAFVKRGDDHVVVMNDEDMPTLRLNQGYRKLLTQDGTEREVKDYVKERYRSALQLMRNIEQRKSTILRTCEAILRRQTEFLEYGVDALKPMMIKEVAEEIGVHPSTVSRAVSNKYVHTPQGVFELRFFFSEGVNGPEGASTPLLLLKRKVKKLIEEEDPKKPLTDDLIASMLQQQGIQVTRRTVAKYREDLRIPSTHQRRIRQ